jgi:hypothetical protein
MVELFNHQSSKPGQENQRTKKQLRPPFSREQKLMDMLLWESTKEDLAQLNQIL